MKQREHEQAPGTPTWSDVTSADPQATSDFFTELLGWQVDDANQDLGGYRVAMAQQMAAGAISEVELPEGQSQEHDETLIHLSTEDVEATLATLTELGGSTESGPQDVAELGRTAVCVDPQGNRFGLWQAGSLGGFSAVDDEGLPTWLEVRGKDLDALADFYSQLFGLAFEEESFPDGRYLLCSEFGITDAEPGWILYYWVADLDASVERAKQLGASVDVEPYHFAYGSSADLRTPGGARFGLFQPAEQQD